MTLDMSIHPWYYPHNQGNKHILNFQKFPCVPSSFFVVRMPNVRCAFLMLLWTSPVAQPAMQETHIWYLDWEDPSEKGMATQPSILGVANVAQKFSRTYSSCIIKTLYPLKKKLYIHWTPTPHLKFLATTIPLSAFRRLTISLTFYISGILWYLSFWDWLT